MSVIVTSSSNSFSIACVCMVCSVFWVSEVDGGR